MKGKDRRLMTAVSGFLLFVACLIFGLINVSTVNAAQSDQKNYRVTQPKVATKSATKVQKTVTKRVTKRVALTNKSKEQKAYKPNKKRRALNKIKKTKTVNKTARLTKSVQKKVTRTRPKAQNVRRVIQVSFKETETKQKPGATVVPVEELNSTTSNPGGMEVALMPRNR